MHTPAHSRAKPSGGSLGGTSSHSATSVLHAASPSPPRRSSSISSASWSGGSKAGGNAGNRSWHSWHVNFTMRVRIACAACTARTDASRSCTSYFATRSGTVFSASSLHF